MKMRVIVETSGLGIVKVSKRGWEGRFQNRKRRSADEGGDSKVM